MVIKFAIRKLTFALKMFLLKSNKYFIIFLCFILNQKAQNFKQLN